MMNKNILMLGLGEVGKAIKQIEVEGGNNVTVIDPRVVTENTDIKFDVINICFPYSETFTSNVLEYLKRYTTKLVIIHSTVAPGTTMSIRKQSKVSTVHSPVRGIHPNLYNGVKTFVKFIGGTKQDCSKARNHFLSLNLKPQYCGKAKSTELGKILSTSYYGWNILFAKQVAYLCRKYKVSYDTVYKDFNNTYNEGYEELERPEVRRPVLVPPEEIMGGHCVTQNIEFLPRCKLKKFFKKLNEEHRL